MLYLELCKLLKMLKSNYKGYGIRFDKRNQFGHTITEDGITYTSNGRKY